MSVRVVFKLLCVYVFIISGRKDGDASQEVHLFSLGCVCVCACVVCVCMCASLHTHTCVCVCVCVYGGVCVCVCSISDRKDGDASRDVQLFSLGIISAQVWQYFAAN